MEAYPIECNYSEGETTEISKETSNIKNKKKIIEITSGKKTFEIEFKNEIDFLLITAKQNDSLFPVIYTGKFTLKDIKKVGLFHEYESIDECLFDIFDGLDSKQSKPFIIEKDNLEIIISVPLHTKKYPEITFSLKQNKNNEPKKYEELIEVLLNMKKEKDEEIKELKDKINKLEKLLQIKENDKKQDEFKGSKFEIFNIGKDEYSNFFSDEIQYIENLTIFGFTLIFECKENDIQEIMNSFIKYKNDIKKIFNIDQDKTLDLKVRNKKNKIFFDLVKYKEVKEDEENNTKEDFLFHELIESYDLMSYFPLMTNGLKAKLITEGTLLDLFESSQEKMKEIIFNTKLLFEGETIKSKILMSFLILVFNDVKDKEIGEKFYNLVNDIFLTVINGNYCYQLKNEEMFTNFEEDIGTVLLLLKTIFYGSVYIFKDPKYKVFQKLDFNKIKLGICGSPKFKVGYLGLNFESQKNNEFINKVLNDKIKMEN